MIFLLSFYTNILCYSLIIYICSMYVFYFMHNFIIISSFSPFPHSIICNPVCCDEKCFIFFFYCLAFSALLCCFLLLARSPSLLRAPIIFIILRPLFRIKKIRLGTVLRSFFPWINLNFPNQTDWFKIPESIGEVAVDQSKFISWRVQSLDSVSE